MYLHHIYFAFSIVYEFVPAVNANGHTVNETSQHRSPVRNSMALNFSTLGFTTPPHTHPTVPVSTTATTETSPTRNNHNMFTAGYPTTADVSDIEVASTVNQPVALVNPAVTATAATNVGSDNHQMSVEVAGTDSDTAEEDEESFETTVTDQSWFLAIQEEKKENPSYKTKRGYWPTLWKMAGTFVDDFRKADFYKTRKNFNQADFKGQIIQHILSLRTKVSKNEIPEKYLSAVRTGNGNPYRKSYFYYSKENFINHAIESYKYDRTTLAKRNKILPNDVIRFYSVLTRDINLDDLQKLSCGKAFKRSDLDGALSLSEQVMHKLSIQFNDPNLVFTMPKRAVYLSSYEELNPNDMERIKIKRDYKFMMEIWKYCSPKYNHCWQKWTKGTGGGSGAEEDFENWEKREMTEKFADYAASGSCDMMAYIYMLDKDVGFMINAINDPAPSETVLEDGEKKQPATSTPAKRRKTAQDRIAENVSSFNDMMKSTLQVVREAFNGESKAGEVSDMVAKQEAMHWNVSHINNLNEQIDIIKAQSIDSDDGDAVDRRKNRIEMLNEALDCAFKRLNELNK